MMDLLDIARNSRLSEYMDVGGVRTEDLRGMLTSFVDAVDAARAAASDNFASCCTTPAYCSSVRRCTAKDERTPNSAAPGGDVEQRARELLAAEYEKDGLPLTASDIRADTLLHDWPQYAIRAIIAARSEPKQVRPDPSLCCHKFGADARVCLLCGWNFRENGDAPQPVEAEGRFFVAPPGLHPNTINLIGAFAGALAEKLAQAEKKYGYSDGWASQDWMDECRAKLVEHIAKGDPRDVAAYCAFLWHHGESTTPPPEQPAIDLELFGYPLPFQEGYSNDGGDTWYECPDDAAFVDGLAVGDTYELQVCHYSVERTYRVTKAPDEESDDYEVVPVAIIDGAKAESGSSFQSRVSRWMDQCFLPSLYSNMTERGDRLLEEVLELLQSGGYDRQRVATLVDYVYNRPPGEPSQEVGGVMVTLAGYCWIAGLDMHADGERELARILQPEVMAKIRAKQAAKNALHFDTPLPGPSEARGPGQRRVGDPGYRVGIDPLPGQPQEAGEGSAA